MSIAGNRSGVIGCGIFATDEGVTLKGSGCIHDNDNALLSLIDLRALSLRRGEEVWFYLPGAIGGARAYVVGLVLTGVKDFMNRDGIAGATAVVTEASLARDGFTEAVFAVRSLKRAMLDRMVDRNTLRVHMASATSILRQTFPDVPPSRPGVDEVEVNMERALQQVSMPRGWASEIGPDALMLMMRNQREIFGPLLDSGYVLREEVSDKTSWAIDAEFYKKFHFREIYQKHKNLVEGNSRLEDELAREKIRNDELRAGIKKLQADVEAAKDLERRARDDAAKALGLKADAERARDESENARRAAAAKEAELDARLNQIRALFETAQKDLENERGVVARLQAELDRASDAPLYQRATTAEREVERNRSELAGLRAQISTLQRFSDEMERHANEWEAYARSLERGKKAKNVKQPPPGGVAAFDGQGPGRGENWRNSGRQNPRDHDQGMSPADGSDAQGGNSQSHMVSARKPGPDKTEMAATIIVILVVLGSVLTVLSLSVSSILAAFHEKT